MDERDNDRVEEIINEHHQKQAMYCDEHFLTSDRAMRAFWAALLVCLGLMGTGVGWALTQSNTVSKHEVVLEEHAKSIESLQSIHSTMDTVVTILRQMKGKQF
jgi:hypothetical protein